MNAFTHERDWRTPTATDWKRTGTRAIGDACYILLRVSGWMAMTLLATFGGRFGLAPAMVAAAAAAPARNAAPAADTHRRGAAEAARNRKRYARARVRCR